MILVYKPVKTRDGLIALIFISVEGRKHNTYIYLKSGLETDLKDNVHIGGVYLYLYADKAYVVRLWLKTELSIHRFLRRTHRKTYQINNSVELSYREVEQHSNFLKLSRKLVIRKYSVSILYSFPVHLNSKYFPGSSPERQCIIYLINVRAVALSVNQGNLELFYLILAILTKFTSLKQKLE